MRSRALCSGNIFSRAIRTAIFLGAFFCDGVSLQLAWIKGKGIWIFAMCHMISNNVINSTQARNVLRQFGYDSILRRCVNRDSVNHLFAPWNAIQNTCLHFWVALGKLAAAYNCYRVRFLFIFCKTVTCVACTFCARFNGDSSNMCLDAFSSMWRCWTFATLGAGSEFCVGVRTTVEPIAVLICKKRRTMKSDIFIVRDWDSGQSLTIIIGCFFW